MKTAPRKGYRKPPTTFAELVAAHPPRPIGDDVDLRNAEEVVERLAVLPSRTKDQEDYLEVLSTLIERYEAEHYPIDTSGITPIERLKFLMEQHDMNASDLGRLLGDRTLGPKILSGDRELSKANIIRLAQRFGVNPGMFIAV
jgi:HTH-type transcriptional regulator / antitoxin HigA